MSDTPVLDYVASLSEPRRSRVEEAYAIARDLAPHATEGVTYSMPALIIAGKGLLSVMSTKKHIGIYPYSGSVVGESASALRELGIGTTKGAIQLPDGVELPVGVLRDVVRARLRELGE